MDYLNANFTSLDDLEVLDEKISNLENEKLEVNILVKNKVNGDSQPDQATNEDLNDVIDTRIESILAQIDGLCNSGCSSQESKDKIEQLRLEHGDLAVFRQLDDLFTRRDKVNTIVEHLERAKAVEESLDSLVPTDTNSVELYSQVYSEIEQIISSSSFGPEIQTNLSQLLIPIFDKKVIILKDLLGQKLSVILQKIRWLSPRTSNHQDSNNQLINSSDLKQIQSLLRGLVQLQAINSVPQYPESWWAMDYLLQPFIIRFQYNFMTAKKETNKVSKPEWALEYVEEFIQENSDYIQMVVGDILSERKRITVYEIITTVLKPVREKMLASMNVINGSIAKQELETQTSDLERGSGRLLSHLVFELTSFDQRLRNVYKYNPYIEDYKAAAPSKKWMGLTGDIMLKGGDANVGGVALAASNWLNFESQLANKRFQELLVSENSFLIDFDFQAAIETGGIDSSDSTSHFKSLKPTYSAYSLSKLFDTLTSHYKTLSIVKYQLKYVSNIQLKLLDDYCDELQSQFKRTNGNSVLKYIPGGMNSESTSSGEGIIDSERTGLKNLQQLSQIYCSAKYIANKLEFWSEELIFIQLWGAYKSIASELNGGENHFSKESTIFDSSLARYQQITSSVLSKFEELFARDIRTFLKKYVNHSQWDIINHDESELMEVSPDLSPLLVGIPEYLHFLSRCLSSVDYYILSGKIVSIISQTFIEFVITNNKFDQAGLVQLQTDLDYVWSTLSTLLFLRDNEDIYNNKFNPGYVKVHESIELLRSIKPNEVANFGNYDSYPILRERSSTKFSSLSEFEIFDLLHRIK
ncbi:hypothetical protein CAAN1_06S00694 [[Candida] anglica]|uniref:Exocyst complex component SEC15 n=1 Tax=[Candida] anglica TaxID=148631 RepID=A0ABP0EN49_9ASCO